jgi:predicted transcriptional regulator
MRIEDYMKSEVISIQPDRMVREAARCLSWTIKPG